VVTGPIAVTGATPGDLLRIDIVDLLPRAPYGFASSRCAYGALPGELPEGEQKVWQFREVGLAGAEWSAGCPHPTDAKRTSRSTRFWAL
jgi:acetamidase/formamidase